MMIIVMTTTLMMAIYEQIFVLCVMELQKSHMYRVFIDKSINLSKTYEHLILSPKTSILKRQIYL